MTDKRWHVLGAGAVGGWFAGRLAGCGVPVTLLLRDAATVTRWRDAGGFTLIAVDGARRRVGPPEVDARAIGTHGPPPAHLVVATKAPDTLAALAPLLAANGAGQLVLLLQNGMGTAELLRERWPALRLWCAVTTAAIWREDAMRLHVVAEGETLAGRFDDTGDGRLDAAVDDLVARGIVAPADDIRAALWRKLAVNALINGLTAVHGCRNGELPGIPAARAQLALLAGEVERVAQAEGVRFDEPVLVVAEQVIRLTARNYSSMNRDAAAGRSTEIDFINGYVVARAAAHGIAVPANAALVADVRSLPRRA